MSKAPKYFMYFPGNYRWSAAFVNMLGRASYGGADISELHKIGRELAGKGAEDDEAWFDACVLVADEVRRHAERFAASGHGVSAAAFYLRACHYYQMGERFRTPKDKAALDAYRTAVDCFHRFVALTDVKIEIVEVPFEGKSLPGYFVHAQNATSARAPCVVFFDGLDVTKEIQYLAGVPELTKRCISVLVMDGPGTGEAIRFRGLVLRHDYEKAGSACIDFLEQRDDVDGRKIGIVAISLGGYYGARRGRRADSAERCAGALRCLRIERQDVARVHQRGRRRATLPARLSHAGLRDHVELVRGQAPSRVGERQARRRQRVAMTITSPSALRLTSSPQARARRPA